MSHESNSTDSPLFDGYQPYHNYFRPHMSLDGKNPRRSLRDGNQWREQMDNSNPEHKEKVKKIAKLGMKCVWLVVDFLI